MNIIEIILNALSPILRDIIFESVISLRKHAATTDNPLDDIVADFLCKLLNIKD